ncbi:MAG: oleate hydratase [Pseudomonadota bacterium]|nr:oleate hydratase [Pseudomonadota bacterium]
MNTSSQQSRAVIDHRKTRAYLVGGGIASLATAVYLIREGRLSGSNIHILEQDSRVGGALDGSGSPEEGYLIRGGRMHEAHFVCAWDLLSGIPTLSNPDQSVTDEVFEFNKKVISDSRSRLLKNGGKMDVSSYGLGKRDQYDMLKLLFHSEEALGATRIEDWFSEEFFDTVFWLLWSTTFAFQRWSSLVEMRRYFVRFIHLLPDFNKLGGIMRTVYNQYDSIILPIQTWLEKQGVRFLMNSRVTDIDFDITDTEKTATNIHYVQDGKRCEISLLKEDYVFVTLGSMVENSTTGSMRSPAKLGTGETAGAWMLWENIARKHEDFGRPSVFSGHVDQSKWMSFTATLEDPAFFDHMEVFTGNKPGTGGLVTITDSNWFMSVVLPHQPHFIDQPEDVFVFWGDGLLPDNEGNFVNKKMSDCTGEEILTELFSHLGIMGMMQPVIDKAICIPCMMPFIDSQFLPRVPGDRPRVVPEGSTNFAFIGQFVEVPDDCVFTVEYSVRTAQTAVFTLLKLDREVSPVYEGIHDPHVLLDAFKAITR